MGFPSLKLNGEKSPSQLRFLAKMSTLESLQRVLASVEELKLPEGDYLRVADALKNALTQDERKVLHREEINLTTSFFLIGVKKPLVVKQIEKISWAGPHRDD